MFSLFFMTHKPSASTFLLNKNDFCLYFELIKKIFYFFRVGGTSGKRCVDPTGKGFDRYASLFKLITK